MDKSSAMAWNVLLVVVVDDDAVVVVDVVDVDDGVVLDVAVAVLLVVEEVWDVGEIVDLTG